MSMKNNNCPGRRVDFWTRSHSRHIFCRTQFKWVASAVPTTTSWTQAFSSHHAVPHWPSSYYSFFMNVPIDIVQRQKKSKKEKTSTKERTHHKEEETAHLSWIYEKFQTKFVSKKHIDIVSRCTSNARLMIWRANRRSLCCKPNKQTHTQAHTQTNTHTWTHTHTYNTRVTQQQNMITLLQWHKSILDDTTYMHTILTRRVECGRVWLSWRQKCSGKNRPLENAWTGCAPLDQVLIFKSLPNLQSVNCQSATPKLKLLEMTRTGHCQCVWFYEFSKRF